MSNATDTHGTGPLPTTSTPAVLPEQSDATPGRVSVVSGSSSEDGASGPQAPLGDVVKRGYMGKAERHHRRYFVLRAGGPHRPARLEWHGTEESFEAMEGSDVAAGGDVLCGCSKRRGIYLRCGLCVSKVSSPGKGPALALYAKDRTLVMVADDTGQQEDWYRAVKGAIEEEEEEEEKRGTDQAEEGSEGEDEEGEGGDEEDDGYCTLTAGVFKEVWLVTVKPRGLGVTKSLAGAMRLCLSAGSLVLVRGSGDGLLLPGATLALKSVRRFGHQEGLFFLEVGRSAPHGPGELWMEAQDQGNSHFAQQVHEAVREAVRALRVLPDFRHSPAGWQDQTKPEVTPPTPPSAPSKTVQWERAAGGCASDAETPGPGVGSQLSALAPQTGGYVEMAVRGVSMATVSGGSYMTMSPGGSRHAARGEDYVAMASPRPLMPWPDLSTCALTAQASSRFSSENPRDWFFPVFRGNAPSDGSRVELLDSSGHASQREGGPTCGPSPRPGQAGSGRSSLRRYVRSWCRPSCLRHAEDQ